jgi:excinuclease ABC subunit A
VSSSRSTVGTLTDINDYLKILWSQLGALDCPSCKIPVKRYSPEAACDEFLSHQKMLEGTILVVFDLSLSDDLKKDSLGAILQSQGFQRFILNTNPLEISRISEISLLPEKSRTVSVVVDRISCLKDSLDKDIRSRLVSSISQAYSFSKGACSILFADHAGQVNFFAYRNTHTCTSCDQTFTAPTPSLFSFNSALGACKECQGFGKVLKIDKKKCVPDERLSIDEGAIACWEGPAAGKERRLLKEFCQEERISPDLPWKDLSEEVKELIFNGVLKSRKGSSRNRFKGIFGWFDMLQGKRHKMHVRVFIAPVPK